MSCFPALKKLRRLRRDAYFSCRLKYASSAWSKPRSENSTEAGFPEASTRVSCPCVFPNVRSLSFVTSVCATQPPGTQDRKGRLSSVAPPSALIFAGDAVAIFTGTTAIS